MKQNEWMTGVIRLVTVLIASAAPVAFPLSQMGYAPLSRLAVVLILPSAAILSIGWMFLKQRGRHEIAGLISRGALAGAVATLALEAIRYPGFRLGFMPGNPA